MLSEVAVAKVGHRQAIYTKPSQHGLQKTLERGFFSLYGIGFKGKSLVFYKNALYSQSNNTGYVMVKNTILVLGVSLFCLASAVQADENNSCNCKNKLSACPQESLTRGAETESLKFGKRSDELLPGKLSGDLAFGKRSALLNRGKDTEHLSPGNKDDLLERGKDTEPLTPGNRSDDLVRSAANDNLTFSKKNDYLERGKSSDDLSFGSRSDNLSRGRDSEPLSRCN
jgi:hypothetical protein